MSCWYKTNKERPDQMRSRDIVTLWWMRLVSREARLEGDLTWRALFEPHQPGTSLDTNNSRDKVLTELIRHNIHMTGTQHNMIPEITFALSVRHKELLQRPAHHTRRDGRRSLICVIRCISNLGDKGKLMSCARPVASPPLLLVTPTPSDGGCNTWPLANSDHTNTSNLQTSNGTKHL